MMNTTLVQDGIADRPATRLDPESKRKRLQLDLSETLHLRLIELASEFGIGGVPQFTRNALALYAHVLEQQKEGYKVQFVKDAKEVEFLHLG
jgi:hypothetical protein